MPSLLPLENHRNPWANIQGLDSTDDHVRIARVSKFWCDVAVGFIWKRIWVIEVLLLSLAPLTVKDSKMEISTTHSPSKLLPNLQCLQFYTSTFDRAGSLLHSTVTSLHIVWLRAGSANMPLVPFSAMPRFALGEMNYAYSGYTPTQVKSMPPILNASPPRLCPRAGSLHFPSSMLPSHPRKLWTSSHSKAASIYSPACLITPHRITTGIRSVVRDVV